MQGEIEKIIISTIEEIKDENPDEDPEKIEELVLERTKEKIKKDLDLDLIENPDETLLEGIKKEIKKQLGIEEEPEEVIEEPEDNNEEPSPEEEKDENEKNGKLEIIEEIAREIEEINRLEEKGKSAKATAASGRIIRKIKQEIQKIKAMEDAKVSDLEFLEQLEVALDEQLEWHKNQLSKRYKSEVLKPPAKVTKFLPLIGKGVVIQIQKVVNCIRQLQESKTNKERIFKIIDLGKEIGVLALTPVIISAKFIVKHWYLILLLLLLFKLPGFNFGKNLGTSKVPQQEPGYEQALESSPDTVYEQSPTYNTAVSSDLSTESLRHEQLELGRRRAAEKIAEAQRAREQEIANSLAGDTLKQEQMEIGRTNAAEKIAEAQRAREQEIANSLAGDALKQEQMEIERTNAAEKIAEAQRARKQEIANSLAGDTLKQEQIEIAKNQPTKVPANPIEAEPLPEIKFEEGTEAYRTYMELINRVNERSNGHIYIREAAQNPSMGWDANPNLVVCNDPGEYIRETCKMYSLDSSKFFDANGTTITPAGYNFILERQMMMTGNDTRFVDIVFQDPSAKYLPDFQKALPKSIGDINRIYDNIKTLNCFETLDDFTAALMSNDPKYDFLRESVSHFINVSETQEALNALGGLGLIMLGSSPVALLGETGGAMTAAELAAYGLNSTTQVGAIEALLRLLQLAPEKAISIYELLQGLQASAPALVPGM